MRTLSRVIAFTPSLIAGVVLLGTFAVTPFHVYAVTSPTSNTTVTSPSSNTPAPSTGGTLTNPLNNIQTLPDLLTAILKGVVEIGSIFLVLMLVYVGFLFVAAQGNEEKIRGAREALVWTVVGGLILLGAEAISLVIQETVKTL